MAHRAFRPQLNHLARAGLNAGTASRATLLVDLGYARLGIDGYGPELADRHAVATAQATEGTSRLARAGQQLHAAAPHAVELHHPRTVGTRSVAPHHSHLGHSLFHRHAQYAGHLFHHGLPAHGAQLALERPAVGGFHTGRGKTGTTRITASSAIGLRQHLGHLADTLIFHNGKLLGCCVEHDG